MGIEVEPEKIGLFALSDGGIFDGTNLCTRKKCKLLCIIQLYQLLLLLHYTFIIICCSINTIIINQVQNNFIIL